MTISVLENVVSMLRDVDGIGGRVYLGYPSKIASVPYITVDEVGHSGSQLTDDGEEYMALLTYQVSIVTESRGEGLDIYKKVNVLFNRYCFKNSSYLSTKESPKRGHFILEATWRGIADMRGATFTE